MSNLSLERLLFDPATVEGPKVGSYIVSSSGEVIGSTSGALDVNVTNELNVDLDYTTDSVTAYQGGGTWAVSGTVAATQSTDPWIVSGKVADDGSDNINPVKVGSHAYDQASALGAVSAAGDIANLASDLYRRIFINDAPNIAVKMSAVSVTDTATVFAATELAGRTRVLFQNLGADPVYVGSSSVATTDGLKVEKGTTLSLEAGEAIALYAIAPAGKTVACRLLELA